MKLRAQGCSACYLFGKTIKIRSRIANTTRDPVFYLKQTAYAPDSRGLSRNNNCGRSSDFRFFLLSAPSRLRSGICADFVPVTAAGPCRICTGFPAPYGASPQCLCTIFACMILSRVICCGLPALCGSGMALAAIPVFLTDSLFLKHNRDIVLHGIHQIAGRAFQPCFVIHRLYGASAQGAGEDMDKLWVKGHTDSPCKNSIAVSLEENNIASRPSSL